MNKSDSNRIHELCSMIATEQAPEKFRRLVEELNHLLNKKEDRLLHQDHSPVDDPPLGNSDNF